MKKNIQTIVLALAICTLNVSCSNAPNQDIKAQISYETSVTNKTSELLSITGNSEKTATDQLDDAQNEKKTVLLIVYKKLDEAKDKALKIANEASVINKPSLILADEPTGNLDPALSADILESFKDINKKQGITILMVTHSPQAAEHGNKRIKLLNGEIVN